jgi:hypothetical protein
MKYSQWHPAILKREQAYAEAIEARDRDHALYPEHAKAELPPRWIGEDYSNPVISALPRGGVICITGSLTILFGFGAYSYIKKRNWPRALICGLLCAGSAYLTYQIWLCYDPSNKAYARPFDDPGFSPAVGKLQDILHESDDYYPE